MRTACLILALALSTSLAGAQDVMKSNREQALPKAVAAEPVRTYTAPVSRYRATNILPVAPVGHKPLTR